MLVFHEYKNLNLHTKTTENWSTLVTFRWKQFRSSGKVIARETWNRNHDVGGASPATGHIKVQFNIRPEISRLIDLGAAKQGLTRSQYVEKLVYFGLEDEKREAIR